MKQLNLDFNQLLGSLESRTLILEADFKAYTPWAGGCAGNATIVVKNGRAVDVCLPDAKGLIGRARWLGRIAVATHLNRNIAMEEAEKPVAAILGSTSQASLVRVVVEPKLSRNAVVKKVRSAVEALSKIENMEARNPERLLEKLLYELGKVSDDPHLNVLADNARLKLPLASIKRARSNEKLALLAARALLPPGLADFKLKVYARTPIDSISGGRENALHKVRAAAALLAATPLLAGLGSITSRGFGRFCIESYKLNLEDYGLKEILDNLSCVKLSRLSGANAKDNAKNYVVSLHKKLGGMLLDATDPEGKHLMKSGHTPVLDPNLTEVVELRDANIYKVLNKISKAVTKQCWKTLADLDAKSTGANLHTWPLGLPRKQKTGGYVIFHSGKNVLCENNVKGGGGRRLSMIHVYPLPPGGNIINVVVAVYKAYDFISILGSSRERNKINKGKTSRDKKEVSLYHVGKFKRSKVFHYLKVAYIASRTEEERNICRSRHSEHLGIYRLRKGVVGAVNPMQIIDEVLGSARDFIVDGIKSSKC